MEIIKHIKYLGMILDSNWNFKDHINYVIRKTRAFLPKLYFLKNSLNLKNKKILFDALIQSQIRYAIEVYGFASLTNLNRLQKLQNKTVKILFANKYCYKSQEIFKKYEIMRVQQLRDFTIIKKDFYKMKTMRNEKKLNKKYDTKTTYVLPGKTINNFGQRREQFYIPQLINKLPEKLWDLDKIGEIKKFTKNWLIRNE